LKRKSEKLTEIRLPSVEEWVLTVSGIIPLLKDPIFSGFTTSTNDAYR